MLAVGAVAVLPIHGISPIAMIAWAGDDWRDEFDDLCSKTTDAMSFTTDELKSLADRCDKLKLRIEKLDETERKVFMKRLLMCRDLYLYVIETRGNK